jgi:hypothetical protein
MGTLAQGWELGSCFEENHVRTDGQLTHLCMVDTQPLQVLHVPHHCCTHGFSYAHGHRSSFLLGLINERRRVTE